MSRNSQPPTPGPLSLAVISPDAERLAAAAATLARCGSVHIREFSAYPPNLDVLPQFLALGFDAILIDLDGNSRFALELVEEICASSSSIVMVFSAHPNPDLILHSMRAGAREFFTVPFQFEPIAKALEWIGSHRNPTPAQTRTEGSLHIFFGAKGGVGVTTIATNFAVALAEESRQSTLLIDLNLHFGDAAMNLGLSPTASILDALKAQRLDAAGLSKLLVRHSSGLAILAAPGEISSVSAGNADIAAIFAVARRQFHHVVVDAGKKIDVRQFHRFDEGSTAFLVTEIGIPELRNANRLISQFSVDHCPKLEIVLNRYRSRSMGITDEHLSKALTCPVQWKVPNDYGSVREMQSSATPIVHQDSPIAGVIRQMARAVCGASAAETEPGQSASAPGLRLPWKTAKRPAADKPAAEPMRASGLAARSLFEV